MTRDEKLEKIRLALLAAHSEIVRAAAAMTAKGVETTPLTQPVVGVTDALVELDDVLNARSADDQWDERDPSGRV